MAITAVLSGQTITVQGGIVVPVSADGKHGIWLPKNPKRLLSDQVYQSLAQMGHSIYEPETQLSAARTRTNHKTGKVETVRTVRLKGRGLTSLTNKEIQQIIYSGQRK